MKILLALFALLVIGLAADPKPPVGVPADAKHFNGKWYHVYVEDAKTWQRARDRAKGKGGQLACAPNEATHKFIADLAQNRTLWLGGERRRDALWYWVSGEQFTFTAWGPNQPEGAKDENGLVIYRGKWGDHNGKDGIPIVGYIVEWSGR